MTAAALLVLSACVSSSPDNPGERASQATDSAVPDPPAFSAQCDPDPSGNALRFRCQVDLQPPGRTAITFQPADGSRAPRTHTGQGEIWMYFMAPQTEYTWEASPVDLPSVLVEGTVTTGTPHEEAQLIASSTGSSSAEMFLTSSPCSGGTAVVVDPNGTVLWYQDLSQQGVSPSMVEVVQYTEDGTVLAISSEFVVEVDWTGATLQVLTPGFDQGTTIHHDVFRHQGHTFTLFQETLNLGGDTTYLDGFYVHDSEGSHVATWRLIDHFSPPIPPEGHGGVVDYSHANSLFVQADGDILLSFRHLSAIAKVRGDWTAPDFGEILWRLSGDPDNDAFGSDFTLSSSGSWPGFVHQHNAHLLDDGRISLFDNRKDLAQRSRVLVLDIDEKSGLAQIERDYELDQLCAFQGSAWPTHTGNPVATCAPEGAAIEFHVDDTSQPIYELNILCATGTNHFIPRFVPLPL